ncbi:MAG: hypothetical protein JWN70_1792 [Planctomycetaceae bacterium]|nr:hypothetical protein [Planctomycetaceae bacterium]
MTTELHTIDHDIDEVLAKLVKHEPRDPEAVRLACERMDQMSEEIRKRIGTVDIAVPAIRELRDR